MMTTGTTDALMTLGHSGKFTAASSLRFTVTTGGVPGYVKGCCPQMQGPDFA
jgi:hypothetical protein